MPNFLDKIKNYLSPEEPAPKHTPEELINLFIDYVKNLLEIEDSLNIKLTSDKCDTETYGQFEPESNTIVVYTHERGLADVLRTLGHEMVHRKQAEEYGELDGSTGSDDENEANELSGIMLREFGEEYPEIFDESLDESHFSNSPRCKWAKDVNRGGYTKDDMLAVCNNRKGGNYPAGDLIEFGEGCPYQDNWNEGEASCKSYAKPSGLEEKIENLLNENHNIICECGCEFDYAKEPESGMGRVKCPNCKKEMNQNAIMLMKEKFYDGAHFHEGYKEIYLNPSKSEAIDLANQDDNKYGLRGGFDANNDLYLWDAVILHHEMEKKLNKKFLLKFDFVFGEKDRFAASENQVASGVRGLDENIVKERLQTAFPDFKNDYMKFLGKFWLIPNN